MISTERSITIAASPNEVWTVLAHFATISTWAPNVDHSCLLSDQTEGIGMVRRIQTGRVTVLETVEHWDPGVSLGYAITGLPPVIRSLSNTWRLAVDGAGTTVTLTAAIDAGSRPPRQLVAKIVGRKLGQASEQMLAGLAAATRVGLTQGMNR